MGKVASAQLHHGNVQGDAFSAKSSADATCENHLGCALAQVQCSRPQLKERRGNDTRIVWIFKIIFSGRRRSARFPS